MRLEARPSDAGGPLTTDVQRRSDIDPSPNVWLAAFVGLTGVAIALALAMMYSDLKVRILSPCLELGLQAISVSTVQRLHVYLLSRESR